MKNNNSKYYILLTFLFCSFITKGQEVTKSSMQKEYDAFISNEKANFTDFKDKRDKEFAQMLKNKWSNFDVQASSKPKSVPLPPKLPDVIPASPQQVDINKIPIVVIPNIIIKDIEPIVDSSNSTKRNKYDNGCSINYFNTKIEFFFDQNLIQDVKDINEIAVSNYWEALSKSDYEDLIQQIKKVGAELSLNDWGYYTLVTKLSQQVNQKENEQTLFTFFMLTHLDYNVKVAKRANAFILLATFNNTIYSKKYINVEGIKYYILSDDNNELIYTFKQNFSKSNRKIDLNLIKAPKLNEMYKAVQVPTSKYENKIEVLINKNLIAFYNQMPMTDLSVFFNSSLDPKTENSIHNYLLPKIKGKNELEAVNVILDFVQHSFEYKTDDAQFGYEKFFFSEELFEYPYSDCEDRSILFAHLVKSLLKLDVIGLEYSTHVACAVKFNANIEGDKINDNKNVYIICDPTYIGASVGMCMPQFKNEKPAIIKIRVN